MAKTESTDGQKSADDFDRGFAGHRRRQARLGLRLSPAERLRWLEQTMDELRGLVGRARQGQQLNPRATPVGTEDRGPGSREDVDRH